MQRWAEVRGGQVAVVFSWDQVMPPAFDPSVALAVEVTGKDPEPGPGWTWDGETFTPPAE